MSILRDYCMSPTNEEIYNTVRFHAAVNNPLFWLRTAESLRLAAHRLGWDRYNEEYTPGAFSIYRLLFGLAMENLLKGILIAFGYKAYDGKQLQSLGVRFPEACFACLKQLLSLA